jgi:hypothetical protein
MHPKKTPEPVLFHGAEAPIAGSLPQFIAFGEPDDHLRLSVLIADALGRVSGKLHEEAEFCMRPKSTWAERKSALEQVMVKARPGQAQRFVAVIVDLDALLPERREPQNRWDDWDFAAQRRQLFDLLCDAIERRTFCAIRPRPRTDVNDRLPEKFVKEATTSYRRKVERRYDGRPVFKLARRMGSEYLPMLDWLLNEKRWLAVEDAEAIVEAGRAVALQRHLLISTTEILPSKTLDAAIAISALRGPQRFNGFLGPFELVSDRRIAEEKLCRADVELLRKCGFLQPAAWVGSDYVYMPNVIRRHLQGLGFIGAPKEQRARHSWLSNPAIDGESQLPLHLEMHFHAVRGGDLKRAKETSRYYGADLRELAYQRSMLAAEESKHTERLGAAATLFREAADIYEQIINDFDSDDAYAHEYLGYNLARAAELEQRTGNPRGGDVNARILKAYEFAVKKEANNPLFDGRWLGFRAEMGADVRVEFESKIDAYLKNVSDSAAGYFAEAVFHGLDRAGNKQVRNDFRKKWAPHVPRLRETINDE